MRRKKPVGKPLLRLPQRLLQLKKAENKTTGGVTRSKSTEKNEDTRKAAPVEKFSLNNEDRQLSGSFERNRGILPVPITGPYVIVSHYGQYAVDGLRNVKLDNKGIDIKR